LQARWRTDQHARCFRGCRGSSRWRRRISGRTCRWQSDGNRLKSPPGKKIGRRKSRTSTALARRRQQAVVHRPRKKRMPSSVRDKMIGDPAGRMASPGRSARCPPPERHSNRRASRIGLLAMPRSLAIGANCAVAIRPVAAFSTNITYISRRSRGSIWTLVSCVCSDCGGCATAAERSHLIRRVRMPATMTRMIPCPTRTRGTRRVASGGDEHADGITVNAAPARSRRAVRPTARPRRREPFHACRRRSRRRRRRPGRRSRHRRRQRQGVGVRVSTQPEADSMPPEESSGGAFSARPCDRQRNRRTA